MKRFVLLAVLVMFTLIHCSQKPDFKPAEENSFTAKDFVCQEWNTTAGAHSLAGRASYKSGDAGWGYYTKGGLDFIGQYLDKVIVSEVAAGFFKAGSCPILIDSEPPVVSITNPVAGVTVRAQVTLSVNVSDNVGVTNVKYLHNETVICESSVAPFSCVWDSSSFTEPTAMTLIAKAYDAAGNEGISEGISFTVDNGEDTTPPQVSFTFPVNGATLSGNIIMKGHVSDNVGVVAVGFTLDGWPGCYVEGINEQNPLVSGEVSSCLFETYKIGDGPHTLDMRAIDAAGNITVSEEVTVHIINIDNEPPVVTFNNTVAGQVISGNEYKIAVDATDNLGVRYVEFFEEYGGTRYSISTSIFKTPYEVEVLLDQEQGPVRFIAQAWDYKNNMTETVVDVIVDKVKPVVKVLSPVSGTTLTGTVTLRLEVSDETKILHFGGVAGFGTVLCESVSTNGLTGTIFECQWDTTKLPNGELTFQGTAQDQGGNWGYSENITVTLANATCKAYTATNSAHISAGRAHAGGYFNMYAYTVGSEESLGFNNAYTTTTIKETSPGYFAKGTCN